MARCWGQRLFVAGVMAAITVAVSMTAPTSASSGNCEVMNDTMEQGVLDRFKDRVSSGDLGRIGVVSRVTGGMPGEGQIEDELILSGERQVRSRSASTGAAPRDDASELSEADARSLFELIGSGVDSLVPRSQASFIPDSVVGSITIEVDGEQATYFYLVDEEQREAQGHPLSPEMADALRRLDEIAGQTRRQNTE